MIQLLRILKFGWFQHEITHSKPKEARKLTNQEGDEEGWGCRRGEFWSFSAIWN